MLGWSPRADVVPKDTPPLPKGLSMLENEILGVRTPDRAMIGFLAGVG
jgi:hypothetical protein